MVQIYGFLFASTLQHLFEVELMVITLDFRKLELVQSKNSSQTSQKQGNARGKNQQNLFVVVDLCIGLFFGT